MKVEIILGLRKVDVRIRDGNYTFLLKWLNITSADVLASRVTCLGRQPDLILRFSNGNPHPPTQTGSYWAPTGMFLPWEHFYLSCRHSLLELCGA